MKIEGLEKAFIGRDEILFCYVDKYVYFKKEREDKQ